MISEDSGVQQIWRIVQFRLTLNITHGNSNSPGHVKHTVVQVSDSALRIGKFLTRFVVPKIK